MKIKLITLLVCLLTVRLALICQEPKELKGNEIESGNEFWELDKSIEPIKKTDPNSAISKFEAFFYRTKNSFTKSNIMEKLGELYTSTQQFDKYLKMCEELIDSGISVFFQFRGNTYPEYTKAFENSEKFASLLKRNQQLVKTVNARSQAEYYLQKPENYTAGFRYPLIMVFHGGVGNIQDMQNYWHSSKLDREYLVAFVQGREFNCSYNRSFGNNGIADIKKIYKKITEDYSIDTAAVILSGQSAGGMLAIDLAINTHIPARGLILAFPIKPENFSADKIFDAGLKGLRVSLICGENDWAIQSQKEMSVIFDKLAVPNRLIIFPIFGHEFPHDFPKQIDDSIDFVNSYNK